VGSGSGIRKNLIPDSRVKKTLDTGEMRWRVGGRDGRLGLPRVLDLINSSVELIPPEELIPRKEL
jgi:hypothetical protein